MAVTVDALFPDGPYRVAPDPAPPDTRTDGERLRDRQAARIGAGLHPLSIGGRYLRLHPDAPHDAKKDDARDYPRCGDCVHRVLQDHHNKTYPKCDVGGRDSSSTASDVRAWFPACVDYEPRDPS